MSVISINALPDWLEGFEFPPTTSKIHVVRRGLRAFHGTWLVGAAAAIVDPEVNQVLLVEQSYRKGMALPGGTLHRKEPPTQAIMREVFEETGLELDFATQEPILLIEPQLMQIHLLFRFDHPIADTRATGRYRREVPSSAWHSLSQLPSPLQYITLLQLARLGLVSHPPNHITLLP